MKTLRENAYGEVEGVHCYANRRRDSVPGVSCKLCSDAILQYVDVSALLFSGWFFTCKPRPAVQEYGEGEHDLYGGDAQVSGWPTL